MTEISQEILNQKRDEIKDDFVLYLRKCVGIDDIDGILDEIKKHQDFNGKNLFDITSADEFDTLREESRAVVALNERSEDENEDYNDILDYYHDFLIAYKFAQEWVKPRKMASHDISSSKNIIVFGAPGTGKTHFIAQLPNNNDENTTRITFHPDSDYASFVGCYKPTKDDNGELTYEFVPQAFTEAYIKAWKQPKDKPYYLIIEEINRGNCAQIFGDLFQLLDRYEEDSDNALEGLSEYPINADKDLSKYLSSHLTGDFSIIENDNIRKSVEKGEKLCLPSNLWILATMNTSDQSLYPMDSAFKRRWEWEYIPISYDKKVKYIVTDNKGNGKGYSWENFLKTINKRIYNATKSEDKQLGFWFVGKSQIISIPTFVNKVVFYLWNDVFKDYHDESNSPFAKCNITFQSFYDINGCVKYEVVKDFIEKGLELELEEDVFPRIDESKQKKESQISFKGKIQVTFPDGTIISGKSDAQVLEEVIEKVGPDKVRNLNIRVAGGPLVAISIDEIPDTSNYRQAAQSHRLHNGMYVFTNSNKTQKIKQLRRIAKETGINFVVSELNQISQNEAVD